MEPPDVRGEVEPPSPERGVEKIKSKFMPPSEIITIYSQEKKPAM